METLGELVARLREGRGLTQAQLAQRAGVDPVTIARVEQNRGPGWWRKTARSVFNALADHTPIERDDAERYFALSKYSPDSDLVERAVANGQIITGPPPSRPPPIPDDITELLGQMIFVFGEARVRALLRTVNAFAISQEPGPAHQPQQSEPPRVPGAVAIDSTDPETGAPIRKFIPAAAGGKSPADSSSRRRKSG